MRILISDYSGHPFQVQLSRELARRGHEVLHVFSAVFQTPKGKLERDPSDPVGFDIIGVRTRKPFAKHSFFKRRAQEIEIGDRIAEAIAAFAPEVVVSSNAPLDTQRRILAATRKAGARFVFWVQDIYSSAIIRVLSEKLGFAGRLVGNHYQRLEARMLGASDHIVVISHDFVPELIRMANIPADRITVVENWAPLDEIDQHPRNSEWATANLPPSRFRAIYSGTIGFKHNPALLVRLARQLDGDVIVFSEGPAADSIAAQALELGLTNLHVRGWLAFADLPRALGGADALIVILEPDAGIYSVPSKVLTYMCVGRPIIGAIPAENLAARLIDANDAGIVVSPVDAEALAPAAHVLAADPEAARRMGAAARRYAETVFDIRHIGDQFEAVCAGSVEVRELKA